jgi:hypothetical protein
MVPKETFLLGLKPMAIRLKIYVFDINDTIDL